MRALYDSKSKTIDDRGMKVLLGQQARVQSWLDVEAALALAQAEHGMIPASAAANIAANCRVENIDLAEMERLLREIGHGFVPMIKVLVKACDSESGKYVHYGVTTQNIQQTAQLYLAKQFNVLLQGSWMTFCAIWPTWRASITPRSWPDAPTANMHCRSPGDTKPPSGLMSYSTPSSVCKKRKNGSSP